MPRKGLRWGSGAAWLGLFVAALLLAALRLHAYDSPLETDECNYAYIGSRLLAGDRLYVDVWDHQPPAVFALLAAWTALVGSSPSAIRSLATVCALGCLLLLYACCRGRLSAPATALATLAFAMASSDPGMAGEGCNREWYMNLLTLAGFLLLLGPCGDVRPQPGELRRRLRRVFLAGLALGLASMLKTVVAAQWLVLLIALCLSARVSRREPLRHVLRLVVAFGLGPIMIWGLVSLYFAATGRFALFGEAVFGFNVGYSRLEGGSLGRFGEFFTRWTVFRSALPLWIAGCGGLLLLVGRSFSWTRSWRAMLVAYAVGSYLAICLPGRFWPHYYLLMLPPLVLLAATAFDRLGARGVPRGSETSRRFWPATTFGTVLIAGLAVLQGWYYVRVPAELIAYPRYQYRMLWARDQGRRVASMTDASDTVYVWGTADAGVYYYSGRRSASGFTMITGLLGEDSGAAARRATLIEDLARNRPRLILVAKEPFPQLRQFFLDHRYVSAGRDSNRMEVLCDIQRPIAPMDWNWSPPQLR